MHTVLCIFTLPRCTIAMGFYGSLLVRKAHRAAAKELRQNELAEPRRGRAGLKVWSRPCLRGGYINPFSAFSRSVVLSPLFLTTTSSTVSSVDP